MQIEIHIHCINCVRKILYCYLIKSPFMFLKENVEFVDWLPPACVTVCVCRRPTNLPAFVYQNFLADTRNERINCKGRFQSKKLMNEMLLKGRKNKIPQSKSPKFKYQRTICPLTTLCTNQISKTKLSTGKLFVDLIFTGIFSRDKNIPG